MDETIYWARRNTRLSYGINAFENASASLPIWLLFFTRQFHYSVTAAIVLMMARWATMALCNIPTGAWLYTKHAYGPWACEVLVLLGAFYVSLFMKEFRVEQSTAHNNRQHIGEALRYVWRHTFLRNFFFALILIAIVGESAWTGLQPIFVLKQIPTAAFGLLFGIIALLSAFGAYMSRHIVDRIDGIRIYWYLTILTVVGTILFLTPVHWLAIVALIPLGLSWGFIEPVGNTNFQRHTSSKYQSTVLSLRSLLYIGFYALVSILVGRYVDLYGTKTMLIIITIQGLIGSSLLGLVWLSTVLSAKKELRAVVR